MRGNRLYGACLCLVTASLAWGSTASGAAVPAVITHDQAVVHADAHKIEGVGVQGGPTPKLLRDLRTLYRDVANPALKIPAAQQRIEISTALANALQAAAKTYADRALIYHALGYKVVG